MEWVDTTEWVPDHDNEVLVWGAKYAKIAFYWPWKDHGDYKQNTWMRSKDGFNEPVLGVTHWAEITPPKGKQSWIRQE